MRYILIDKIKKLEFNKSITALKNVTMAEDFFADHFVGFPVLPGAIQIEAIAQAATALLEISSYYRYKALLTVIEKAKFRKLVRPGDQLSVFVNIISMQKESALVEGVISIQDKIITDGKMIFVLKPADNFYPPKTRAFVESTYDFWLEGAELIGFNEEVRHRNE
jgi:3-hydroxyacyl-[acyl-carrier-protein] dehydratase